MKTMTHKTRATRYIKLAAYIERQPEENFDQTVIGFYGTATCIAGHCATMLGWKKVPNLILGVGRGNKTEFSAITVAAKYLGFISGKSYKDLFSGKALWQTRDAAVAELRRRAKEEFAKRGKNV